MFLLATQAEPQMLEFAHRNLGRLVQPRHYSRVRDTAERGVPWAADNDAFNGGVDAAKFLAMLETISGVPGCRFVTVPDVVADATATLREFERWLPCLLDFDLPLAFVLQDSIAAAEVLSQAGFDGDPETRIPTWKKGTPKPCHDRRNTPMSCSIAAPRWSSSPVAPSPT